MAAPSETRMSSRKVGSSMATPSAEAMAERRSTIEACGRGLKRNLAQREAIGGMRRET